MGTDRGVKLTQSHLVFVGSKGGGKSSLYQCLKSPNPQVIDVPGCSVLVEDWTPFNTDSSPVAEECRKYFNANLLENDLDASVTVWDICGQEALWTIQQLCIPHNSLFVLVFNVRNPRDARMVPQWVQMIQSKFQGAEIIIAASNCEVSQDPCQNVLDEIKKMEDEVLGEISEELACLRDLNKNIWVENRIKNLEEKVKNRPKVCPSVFLTSAVTGKGLSDLRRAILNHLFDAEKSPNENFTEKELNLIKKLRPLHDGKRIVMSGQDYKTMTSGLGFHDDEELESVTKGLIKKGLLCRINISGSFDEPDKKIIITDPCCFANACAMVHRDENPQEFVNKLQKSTLVQRFWPTSTRPNDWTLRSAIDDVVSRGLIRESFLPLCWQMWNMNEEDIKQLLPAMLELGVLVDGAPKAGYEIELALSYFKNLSVTKRYHLPLLLKLPTDPPSEEWGKTAPSSNVSVEWQYKFQEGFCSDLIRCILAATKNFRPTKTVLAHWQDGLVVRIGDVDVMVILNNRLYQLRARCKITNGNRQALHMAWTTLAQFILITETYLSNFPGLYYQFGSPSMTNGSSKSVHQLLSDYIDTTENSCQNLWLIPPLDFQKKEEITVPLDLPSWAESVSGQTIVCISYNESHKDEAEVLGSGLEKSGFDVLLQSCSALLDTKYDFQRCSAVIMLLTKSYIEDPKFEENIELAKGLNKTLIAGYFEDDLDCSLHNTIDLSAGTGTGISHIFNSEQLQSLITECRRLIYGTGDIDPLSDELSEPENNNSPDSWSAVSPPPAMETSQRKSDEPKKKHHVQFANDHVTDHMTDHVTTDESQIKPLAACAVAAAMVGAAAEHLNITRKASSAGMRAANATAKVARAVAHGDADAATVALNDVVKIVDSLSNTLKQQKDNGFGPPPKSKTCVIF